MNRKMLTSTSDDYFQWWSEKALNFISKFRLVEIKGRMEEKSVWSSSGEILKKIWKTWELVLCLNLTWLSMGFWLSTKFKTILSQGLRSNSFVGGNILSNGAQDEWIFREPKSPPNICCIMPSLCHVQCTALATMELAPLQNLKILLRWKGIFSCRIEISVANWNC